MKFVAGIDGGGTKTRVLCRDSEGRELQEAQFGPFNLNSIGLNRFRRLLEEITALFRELGVSGGRGYGPGRDRQLEAGGGSCDRPPGGPERPSRHRADCWNRVDLLWTELLRPGGPGWRLGASDRG